MKRSITQIPPSHGPNRREFLKMLGLSTIALCGPETVFGQSDEGRTLIGAELEPFVDAIPIPSVLRPLRTAGKLKHYRVVLSEFSQRLHRDLPPAMVWGFNGSTPGPLIVADRDHPVVVEWVNDLPTRHRLRVDRSLPGAGPGVPEVRSVIHLHGGHVAPKDDGHPEAWKVPGEVQRTFYPNHQRAATLWYHDHSMGITRLNAMMGLAGFYIIRDPEEQQLRLPRGKFDIPLLVQDRVLDSEGQPAYPISGLPENPWVPEFFGSNVLVNGKVCPFLNVEPRRYRLRFLNGSNDRVFRLFLSPGQEIIQIGTDGGLLKAPVSMQSILIAPSERADVILDFRGREGRRIVLGNDAPSPFPSGGKLIPHLVMQFRVGRELSEPDPGELPAHLSDFTSFRNATPVRTRRIALEEHRGADGRIQRMSLGARRFADPVSEDPRAGTVEVWELVNTTVDSHPIHLHAVHFEVLDRRKFDVARWRKGSEVNYFGIPRVPGDEERGLKDTVLCPPGEVTRIVARFDAQPGSYVWHCHTLEHEDNEMMRPYVVRT